jgi:Arc/MetJ-type ribon-helix-helix transcriptional regulator
MGSRDKTSLVIPQATREMMDRLRESTGLSRSALVVAAINEMAKRRKVMRAKRGAGRAAEAPALQAAESITEQRVREAEAGR